MKVPVLHLLLLVLLTAFVFGNTFFNSFVYDDKVFVVNNPLIKSLRNFSSFFVSAKSYSGERNFSIYRPLAALSFAIDYYFWGQNPFGFHLTNIFWHGLNVILVYLLGYLIIKERLAALLMAALFAIHPVQAETVSWIASRSNLLAICFSLSAFIFYISSQSHLKFNNYYLSSLFFYLLSLLAKETAVILIPLLWVYDYLFQKETDKKLRKYLPFISVTGLYFILRITVLGQVSQRGWWGGSLHANLLTMSKSLLYYLKLILLPVKLSVDYNFPAITRFNDWAVLWAAIVVAFLGWFIYKNRFKNKEVTFGLIWFMLALLPVANFIPIEALVAERFLYLPSVGFALIVGKYSSKLLKASADHFFQKMVIYLIAVLLLFFYGVRTLIRNGDWRNDYTLWASAASSYPDSPRPHYALGNIYLQKGEYQLAIAQYLKVIELNAQVAELYNNLGLSYEAVKDYKKALAAFDLGLTSRHLNENTKVNLLVNSGNVYFKSGMFDKAADLYKTALVLDPSCAGARRNLSLAKEKIK